MPTVTVEGEKSFEVEAGTKLVLAIEDSGIDILHKCGGNARCTTCRVQVLAGDLAPLGDLERERLAREASFGPDIRLSCQVRVESDLTIRVLGRVGDSGIPAGARPID
ncbi:2Fe-2S iron-sulfur cluster-binding protein [Tundrisphaera lichenicola]|uniref:2Fe-2S iron-sulfur cluster-binding protein n=1 Tax=Tundrisphaera lichenicola TaxID=2029860 RepID=UPI003EBFA639